MRRSIFKSTALTGVIFFAGAFHACAEPREEKLEQALLQQLHSTVQSSLKSIYHEKYSQYSCERILSIDERMTSTKKKMKAKPVDAIHGQKYFEITMGLLRTNSDYVELNLKNDTKSSSYYLVNFKKGVAPKDFKCNPVRETNLDKRQQMIEDLFMIELRQKYLGAVSAHYSGKKKGVNISPFQIESLNLIGGGYEVILTGTAVQEDHSDTIRVTLQSNVIYPLAVTNLEFLPQR